MSTVVNYLKRLLILPVAFAGAVLFAFAFHLFPKSVEEVPEEYA